jgi:hypothetical protein
MSDVLSGAGIGGLLGFGFGLLALLTTFRVEPTSDPDVRSVRLIGRMFVLGGTVLGLVVAVLAATFGGPSSALIGLGGGLGMGLGLFAIRRAASGFSGPGPGEDAVRVRARAILGMVLGQGLVVLSVVGLLLAVMLNVG